MGLADSLIETDETVLLQKKEALFFSENFI
jgi:hypothetical protein